jgi:hypothetical protein
MDTVRPLETRAVGQGAFEAGQDLWPGSPAQGPGNRRICDIEMLGKFWLWRHI